MNTFKAALRVIWRHRAYLLVYLFGLSLMMIVLMSGSVAGAQQDAESAGVYESDRATVAVVDRDGGEAGIAQGLREGLSAGCDLIALDDTERALQDAVATNYVDLIIIVPEGYAARFAEAVRTGGDVPAVRTVTSYTSGVGAMARMQMEGLLSSLRSEYRARLVHAGVDADADGALLAHSVQRVMDEAQANGRDGIAVAATGPTASMRFGGYPIMASMTVTVALVAGVFNAGRVRRRLAASAEHPSRRGMGVFLACLLLGVIASAYYLALSALLMLPLGTDASIAPESFALCAVTVLTYALMAVALGFALGQCGVSEEAANGFANVFSLMVAFTGGAWFPASLMPDAMLVLGHLLPGWWYGDALGAALGLGKHAASGPDAGAWASSTGLVLMYAAAFTCVGLAVGAIRARRPRSDTAERTTELAVG